MATVWPIGQFTETLSAGGGALPMRGVAPGQSGGVNPLEFGEHSDAYICRVCASSFCRRDLLAWSYSSLIRGSGNQLVLNQPVIDVAHSCWQRRSGKHHVVRPWHLHDVGALILSCCLAQYFCWHHVVALAPNHQNGSLHRCNRAESDVTRPGRDHHGRHVAAPPWGAELG